MTTEQSDHRYYEGRRDSVNEETRERLLHAIGEWGVSGEYTRGDTSDRHLEKRQAIIFLRDSVFEHAEKERTKSELESLQMLLDPAYVSQDKQDILLGRNILQQWIESVSTVYFATLPTQSQRHLRLLSGYDMEDTGAKITLGELVAAYDDESKKLEIEQQVLEGIESLLALAKEQRRSQKLAKAAAKHDLVSSISAVPRIERREMQKKPKDIDPFSNALRPVPEWYKSESFKLLFDRSVAAEIDRSSVFKSNVYGEKQLLKAALGLEIGGVDKDDHEVLVKKAENNVFNYLRAQLGSQHIGRLATECKRGDRVWWIRRAVSAFVDRRMPIDDISKQMFNGSPDAGLFVKAGVAELLKARRMDDLRKGYSSE